MSTMRTFWMMKMLLFMLTVMLFIPDLIRGRGTVQAARQTIHTNIILLRNPN